MKFNSQISPLPFLFLIGFILNCSTILSEKIKSEDLFAEFTIISRTLQSIEIKSLIGSGNLASKDYITLSDSDILIATLLKDTSLNLDLTPSILSMPIYGSSLTLPAIEDNLNLEVTITLNRQKDNSSLVSQGTLPLPFEFISPTTGNEFSRLGSDIVFLWDVSGTNDDMAFHLFGTCNDGHILNKIILLENDTGTYTFSAGSLPTYFGSIGGVCTISFELRRQRPGTLSPNFGQGGQFILYQSRTVSLVSNP